MAGRLIVESEMIPLVVERAAWFGSELPVARS